MDSFKPLFGKKEADALIKEIASRIDSDSKKNIRQQITPDNTPFKALSKVTVSRKKKKGSLYPNKALIDTGIMIRAIRVKRLGLAKYEVGVANRGNPSREELAYRHNIGYSNQFGPVPARPFLGISAKRLDWIDARLDRWITTQLQKAKREGKKKVIQSFPISSG